MRLNNLMFVIEICFVVFLGNVLLVFFVVKCVKRRFFFVLVKYIVNGMLIFLVIFLLKFFIDGDVNLNFGLDDSNNN